MSRFLVWSSLAVGFTLLGEAMATPLMAAPLRSPATATEDRGPRHDRYGDPLPPGALARFGTVRFRQGEAVSGLKFLPDGKSLAAQGLYSHSVQIWQVPSGKPALKFGGLPPQEPSGVSVPIRCLAGNTLAARAGDFSIRLWDLSSGVETGRLQGHTAEITSLDASADGRVVVSCSADQTVRLWDVVRRAEINRLVLEESPAQVVISPDGVLVAFVDATSRCTQIWRTRPNFKMVGQMSDGPAGASCLAFSPDGKLLAGGALGQIAVWDPAGGKDRAGFASGTKRQAISRDDAYRFLLFSPDGKSLVVVGADEVLTLYDVATGRRLWKPSAAPSRVHAADFSPRGEVLAVGGADGIIRLLDAKTGDEISPGGGRSLNCVCFSPDGRELAAGGDEPLVRRWRTDTGGELPAFSWASPGARVLNISYSPDGRALSAGAAKPSDADDQIRIWDLAGGKVVRTAAGCVAVIARDGRHLLAVRQSAEDLVEGYLLDLGDGHTLRTFQGWPLSLSDDTRLLACLTGEGETVVVWDVFTGKKRRQVDRLGKITRACFSRDNRCLATVNNNQSFKLIELATGGQRVEFVLPQPSPEVKDLDFSPDGRFLAAASADGVVRIWDVSTGAFVHSFSGHLGGANAVLFSPDGRSLASAGGEGCVLLWDMTTIKKPPQARRTLAAPHLAACWDVLAGTDAGAAAAAARDLTESPAQAVSLVSRLPSPAANPAIGRLIADLDSEEYSIRAGATRALEQLGPLAEPALRRAAQGPSSLEVSRRAFRLLRRLEQPVTDADRLRGLRGIEVLERLRTPEAVAVLGRLAAGPPGDESAEDARQALDRLAALDRLERRAQPSK